MFTWLKHPSILGYDVAGEVVAVGKDVTRFQVRDRVVGFAVGTDGKVNDPAEGAFQEYVVLRPDLTSPIPSSLSYEAASVIPLGLSTAAAGLFQEDTLALHLPSLSPKPTNQTLIVWGGSTSVGCNAIQLGVAAGYEVFTTCSPSNFDLVRRLGASKAFDYRSKSVVPDMINAMKGKTAAGALTMGDGAAEACMQILAKCKGNKFVAMATGPLLKPEPQSLVLLRTAVYFVSWMIAYKIKGLFNGVKSNFIFSTSVTHNGVGKAVFADFLPKALENGIFVASPEPFVVGKGLEAIQEAFSIQEKGVSAKKVVVSL